MTIKQAFSLVHGCNIFPDAIITVQSTPWYDELRSGWEHRWVAVQDRDTFVFDREQGGWVKAGLHFKVARPAPDFSSADAFDNIEVLPEPIRSAVRIAKAQAASETAKE